MNLQHNVSLKPYNTFGIEVNAKNFVSVESIDQLISVLEESRETDKFILSGGSNMLLTKDIDALVIHLNLKGIEVVSQNASSVNLKVAAGENWNDVVNYCLEKDYGGIENLSLIPGNSGSTPIQNIGAYGVEIKDVLVDCEAINVETLSLKTFKNLDCKFGYRESIFKNELKDKFIVTSVTLNLTKTGNHTLKTDYGAIRHELEKKDIKNPTIQDVSKAIVNIRSSKLPDPKEIGNSGSFFKNPIIPMQKYTLLKTNFPEIPNYAVSEFEVKIPAGWLIEKAGFKGKRFGNYGVHADQALVLVNYGGASGTEIKRLSELIQLTVKKLFDIEIEREVNVF